MVQRSSSVVLTGVVFVLGLLSSIGDASAQSTLEFDRSRSAGSPIRTLNGFVENHGQWPDDVLFFARQGPIEATLRRDALVLRPQHDPESDEPRAAPVVIRLPQSAHLALEGEGLLPTKHHFLIGDSAGHRSHVPSYERIVYRGLAPGVDMVVRAEDTGFAYDLHLEPGAELGELALEFENVSAPRVRDDGVLVLDTESGPLEQHIGAAWEVDEAGERVEVQSRFRLFGTSAAGEVSLGFEAPTRRTDRAYVLDPSLIFSTYIGGSGQDNFRAMDVAGDGSSYLIAQSFAGMPIGRTAPDAEAVGIEAWVGKLSPDGTTLEWGTFLGGAFTEKVMGIHLDDDGTVVAVGRSWSNDFPTTPGSLQPTSGSPPGMADIFVTRLAADGASLVWSTFYGGPEQEGVDLSAMFSNGDVLVVGLAKESMPPATPGAYDTQWDDDDAYLLRISADGTAVVFQSFFPRVALDVVIGPDDRIHIAGAAGSVGTDLGTPGAYQQFKTPGAAVNAIVLRMDPLATEIQWATYVGGSDSDNAIHLALDPAGAIYIAGSGSSLDYPVTPGAFDTTNPQYQVTKLLPDGTGVVWATYLTSVGAAQALWDLEVDRAGNVIVTGSTNGPDFPTTPNAFQPDFIDPGTSGDATLTKLDAFGEALEYSTFFGGFGDESFVRLGLADSQLIRMGLMTGSSDLFVTPGSYQTSIGGGFGDVAVTSWDLDLLPWTVLGSGLKGTTHVPNLAGTGELTPGSPTRLSIRGALPGATAWFVVGLDDISLPFKGGTFVPAPTLLFSFTPDSAGTHDRNFPWIDVPAGFDIHIQAWLQDPGGILGWSASNALRLTTQ